ncbi:MAG: endolytic transglycosylase MltG [Anaerolineales bacterium]|nr:endolytic transglycosylase MltG [Anaerolineales bacterium]
MKSRKKSRFRGILILSIVFLVACLFCLFSGILFSIPSRTAELYGPPDPNLNSVKLMTQSLILLFSEEELSTPSNIPPVDLIFPIESGDSLDQILTGLQNLGLVRHPAAFRAYLIYTGIDTRIQPGKFHISSEMSEMEIGNMLGSAAPVQTTISILAGWRMEEIAATLPGLGVDLSPEKFLESIQTQMKEGYLYPGSYPVEKNISADNLVDTLYQEFLSQISPDLEIAIIARGLTIQQAVILASIIEREAVLDAEMPLIASVFLNRLQIDMNLAADPTVQYALGYNEQQQTWWTNPLSLEDLNINSPYNTYLNRGLPPGPICNPGYPAIQAVAYPTDSQYLYFRAACDNSGKHLFAETFEEHLKNACPE